MSVEWPALLNTEELGLAGNGRAYQQFLAFYDGTTNTGALLYRASGIWHLQQPVLREVFWMHCDALDQLVPSEVAAAQLESLLAKPALQ